MRGDGLMRSTWPAFNRATSVLLCAATGITPLRIEEPDYNRETGIWRLKLPNGCGHLPPGPDGAAPLTFGGLPRLPSGREVMIGEQNVGGVGGKMWRSAGALCRWQLTKQHE